MKILSWIQSQGERRWLLILVVVALVVRLGWAGLMMERRPCFDERSYVAHAIHLSQGEGYVNERGVAYWPVGYPLLLAAAYRVAGTHPVTGIILQVILGILTCLLLYLLGKRTFGILIARVASLFLAIYPTHVFYSTLQISEPLFTLLLTGVFALLLWNLNIGSRWGNAATGILLGLAALTRPAILLFPLLLPFWYVSQGRRWRHAFGIGLLVFCSTMVTISPWVIRNHKVTGRWTISDGGGHNFWVGNNPSALGGYARTKDVNASLWNGAKYDWQRGYRLGWETIRDAPLAAVSRTFRKISYFFALETDGVLWNLKGFKHPPPLSWTLFLLFLANTAYIVMLGTGLLGLLSSRRSSPISILLMLLAGYTVIVVIAFVGDPRYHFPLVPFILLFSSKGFLHDGPQLVTALRVGEVWAKRRMLIWSAIMFILVLTMVGNLWLKYLESQPVL